MCRPPLHRRSNVAACATGNFHQRSFHQTSLPSSSASAESEQQQQKRQQQQQQRRRYHQCCCQFCTRCQTSVSVQMLLHLALIHILLQTTAIPMATAAASVSLSVSMPFTNSSSSSSTRSTSSSSSSVAFFAHSQNRSIVADGISPHQQQTHPFNNANGTIALMQPQQMPTTAAAAQPIKEEEWMLEEAATNGGGEFVYEMDQQQQSMMWDCDVGIAPPPLNELSQIVYTVLMPIACLLGVIGAMICVFIFTRRQMRSSLSIYLAALSSFDFVLLLCATIIYPSMNLCLQEGNRGPICHFFWRSSLATYPLSLMAQTASVWTVVAITVDRYLAVRYPLHMRAWCTPHRARTVVLFISVVAVLFKMPSFFEVTLDECGRLMKTSLRDHRLYFTIYYTYGYLLLMLAAPFLFIIVLNARILSAIRMANQQRRQMQVVGRVAAHRNRGSSGANTAMAPTSSTKQRSSSCGAPLCSHAPNNASFISTASFPSAPAHSHHHANANHHRHQHHHQQQQQQLHESLTTISNSSNIDNRCTKMAVITIGAFIAFNLLAGVNHVIEAFNLLQDDGQNLRIPIGNFMVCLNSATNILIYSIFGRRFRKMFVIQFCSCWRQKYMELNRSTNNKTELMI